MGLLWRIPERKKVEAVFFDVDGTLTDAQGRIPDRTVSVLEYMAKRLPLFFGYWWAPNNPLSLSYSADRTAKLAAVSADWKCSD